jgi:hypothetical protein
MDLQTLYGIGGAPVIQQMVQYLKDQWKMPTVLAPWAAFVFAMAINYALGTLLLHADFKSIFLSGMLTTLAACGWHEIQKS